MEIRYEDIDQVQISRRLRSLNQAKVDELAESMSRLGQQQPISVWSDDIDTLELVAGLHRLEAARKLGWEEIACVFVWNLDDLDRQLLEIDENLCRAELDPKEEALHLKRRKELFEAQRNRDLDLDKEVAQLDDDLKGAALNEADRAVKTRRLKEIEETGYRARLDRIAGNGTGGRTSLTGHEKGSCCSSI